MPDGLPGKDPDDLETEGTASDHMIIGDVMTSEPTSDVTSSETSSGVRTTPPPMGAADTTIERATGP